MSDLHDTLSALFVTVPTAIFDMPLQTASSLVKRETSES